MRTFAEAVCERFGCAPEEYRRVVLQRCLYPQARIVQRVLPFQARPEDLELVESVGTATSAEVVAELLREYWDDLHLRGGFLAKRWKLRISGERLKKLFAEVMQEGRGAAGDSRKRV